MKILLISGFLGAGKTSFIKHMAKAAGREFVIVENEFGDMGVDGEILKKDMGIPEASDEGMKIWQLSEGCICCSLNLDFTHSVLTIANSLDPEYLIVEPSGIAMPGNIVKQLGKVCYERIELLPPITIIDGEKYKIGMRDFPEYMRNQLSTAGIVVVSKSENMSQADFAELKDDLSIDDRVIFPHLHYSYWEDGMWWKILGGHTRVKKFDDIVQVEIPEGQNLESMSLRRFDIISPDKMVYIMENLITGEFGRVVRAKGYFSYEKEWLRFDLVEDSYVLEGSDKMPDERIVIIGKGLYRERLRTLLW